MVGFALRHKWLVVVAWLALIAASIVTLTVRLASKETAVDNSVGIWFKADDPDLQIYEDFNRQFGEKEWSILLLRADSIFEPAFLRDLAQITARLEQVEHVTKVVSLTNVRDSESAADGTLVYRRLYPAEGRDTLLSTAEVEVLEAKLHQNPILEKSILRRADRTSTVVLFQNDNFIRSVEPYRIEMVDAIKSVMDGYPRVTSYSLAGTSVINAELNRASQRDGIRFYILATLFICAAAYLSLRNWRDLLIVLSVVTAGVLPSMAAIAISNIPFNMVTVMLPPILVTLSVCDVVHVISTFHAERRKLAPAPAIVKTIDAIWWPCLSTSIVAAIGFLSLASSSVYPIWQMGIFSTLGIALTWFMSMSYVPVMLVWAWPRGRTADDEGADGSKAAALYSRRIMPLLVGPWRWVWLGVAGVLLLLTATGLGKLEVDTDYTKFFGKDTYVTRAYPEIERAGYGQNPVALMVRFPEGTTYASGDNFARIRRLEDEIRKDSSVVKLLSFTDLLTRADVAFNGESEEGALRMDRYGSEQLQQLHLLAEIGGNDDLRDFVTEDKRVVQLVAMAPYMSSKKIEAFKTRVYEAGAATLGLGTELKVTGTTVQWGNMDNEISDTQMSSMYVIAGVFLVLLPLMFRSLTLGVIGVFINSAPMVVTFGLMGLLDIKINIATALIGGVTVGATVDSTIFLINRVRAGRDAGLSWDDAVTHALTMVGDGIIITGLILTGGFCCLAVSSFLPTAHFGMLLSVSIFSALFFDIVVAPIVLRLAGSWLTSARGQLPRAAQGSAEAVEN